MISKPKSKTKKATNKSTKKRRANSSIDKQKHIKDNGAYFKNDYRTGEFKSMKSGKWLLGGICLQLATGYTVAFGVYQIGTLITTGSFGTAFIPGLIAVIVFALIILWRIRKSDKEFASEYSLHSVKS